MKNKKEQTFILKRLWDKKVMSILEVGLNESPQRISTKIIDPKSLDKGQKEAIIKGGIHSVSA
jgi:alpha-D-ribose 1-methylphosphonate 5-triphosphate synthase subunit PhnH